MLQGTHLYSVFYDVFMDSTASSLTTLGEDLKQVGQKPGRSLILSRIGQSFSVQSLGQQKFLVTDSHVKTVGAFSYEGCLKYLLHAHTQGYSVILWAIRLNEEEHHPQKK